MNFNIDEPTKEELEEPPIEFDTVEDEDNDIDDFTEEEIEEALEEIDKEIKPVIDIETGEILPITKTFDKETMIMLSLLLDGKMEVK